MKYCKKCVMPSSRPGIVIDEEGICAGCRAEEIKDKVDWDTRFTELEKLCDKYRNTGKDGYDCMIAVSGGKDSHFQVHIMKERLGMNPLLVSVEDNFPMPEAGKHNIKNISEEFGCDIISLKPNIRAQKILMRKTFEKYGKPTWYIDRLIYTYPVHMAIKFSIPFLIYGENVNYEYGGSQNSEAYSAKDQVNNDVASDISWDVLLGNGVEMKDMGLCIYPSKKELEQEKLEPIYLSYFIKWNSYRNYIFAKKRGFKDLTHEWKRQHHVEDFDSVDTRAYLVHAWMKYPKFGHASATDYLSRFIRYGMITRQEAIELVKKHDHALDHKAVDDFVDFAGYSRSQFWNIIDKFYNKDIFEKDNNRQWKLKDPLWQRSAREPEYAKV